MLEVLPEFSPYKPATDLHHKFIPPVDHSRLPTIESSEDGFKFVHLRSAIESKWDSSELGQTSKSDCVQLIICGSLIKASPNVKLSLQGFFYKIFLQEEEKIILSLLSKNNVSVIPIGHFVKKASPEFFGALIFELVDTDREHSLTAIVYLATFTQYSALKLPIYIFSVSQPESEIKTSVLYYSNQVSNVVPE